MNTVFHNILNKIDDIKTKLTDEGVNIYYPEVSDLYEQFNVQNWIKLNNKDDLNLTKLHCYITDVHNENTTPVIGFFQRTRYTPC